MAPRVCTHRCLTGCAKTIRRHIIDRDHEVLAVGVGPLLAPAVYGADSLASVFVSAPRLRARFKRSVRSTPVEPCATGPSCHNLSARALAKTRGTLAASRSKTMASSSQDAHASLAAAHLTMNRPAEGVLELQLTGAWRVGASIPGAARVGHELGADHPEHVRFETHAVVSWDFTLVAFVTRVAELARSAGVDVDCRGLPSGVQRLLALLEATPIVHPSHEPPPSGLARIGTRLLAQRDAVRYAVHALGELTLAFSRLVRGKAKFRRSELWIHIQATGASALGVVGLVTALVGLIIAFISALQLRTFGATLYVASLVGIAMVRDLGAVMAAVVLAGRTGAAFAAELGTMRITQEIDALTILGLSPVEFLALPRVLAVTLMMPLLCVYADLLGVAGGAIVGIGLMDIGPRLYANQTIHAVSLTHLFGGMFKATTYGFLIGAAGCFIGLRSGRTAADVGRAATSAVVTSIVLVIVACGLYAIVFDRLGI